MSESVRNMFSAISRKYDLMNSLITLGLHKKWRKKAVALSNPGTGNFVLDCAAGTGDFAFEFKKIVGNEGKVVAVDFSSEMLSILSEKSEKLNLQVEYSEQDVSALSFPDNYFDIASVGFGVRNFDDPVKTLNEITRVLKNNGKIVILETGQPNKIISMFYKIYSVLFIKPLGKIISDDRRAYDYLVNTASAFPYGDKFIGLMENTGTISECRYQKLVLGVAYIYTGVISK
jgi:demethylmenaquinone methyltransferase/2-methoxy-6-polyprenyl-1,4-benzoquinol methylase